MTATPPDPLNVNDATTRAWEQPPGWYSGADSSVAFSVGLFGLTAVPSARGTANVVGGPCIEAALTVMISGAVQFAQCCVRVVLKVVLMVMLRVVLADTRGSLCDIHGDRVYDVTSVGVVLLVMLQVVVEVEL